MGVGVCAKTGGAMAENVKAQSNTKPRRNLSGLQCEAERLAGLDLASACETAVSSLRFATAVQEIHLVRLPFIVQIPPVNIARRAFPNGLSNCVAPAAMKSRSAPHMKN